MAHNIYTPEQIEILLNNPHVAQCSSKYITFTPECRKEALRLYEHEGLSPRQVFEVLAFPEFISQSPLPKNSLGRWKATMKEKGFVGLDGEKKGRKKKEREIENRTPKEQIEYMRAKIAYLERENDFLRLCRVQDIENSPYRKNGK